MEFYLLAICGDGKSTMDRRPILKTCFPKNGGFACLATLLSSRSREVHCNVHLEIIANKKKFGIGNIRFQVSVRRTLKHR